MTDAPPGDSESADPGLTTPARQETLETATQRPVYEPLVPTPSLYQREAVSFPRFSPPINSPLAAAPLQALPLPAAAEKLALSTPVAPEAVARTSVELPLSASEAVRSRKEFGTGLATIAVVVGLGIVATLVAGVFSSGASAPPEAADVPVEVAAPGGADPASGAGILEPGSWPGSAIDAFAVGDVITTDEWIIVVNSANLSASEIIAEENTFNLPAGDGRQYALVNLTLTYLGADSLGPYDVEAAYVTLDDHVASERDSFVVVPEPNLLAQSADASGSMTGNLAISIPSELGGILRLTPGYGAEPVFVAVG